jgi:cytosine/adenosine deaminase-related metal-dependent hydrolase
MAGGTAAASRLPADTLLRHGRIITMDRDRRILVDGALAVRDGRIVAIGPDRDVSPQVNPSRTRDLRLALVHPGFIDAHAHTSKEIIRGLLPDARDWSDFERPFVSSRTAEEEYLSAALSCMEMVANGTTLYVSTGDSFFLESDIAAAELVGLRAIPGYLLADLAVGTDRLCTPTEVCLTRLVEQIERHPFRGPGRIRCAVTLWGMAWKMASDRLLVEAKAVADRYQVPLVMHQSWSEEEVRACRERTGRRPIAYLADLGVLDRDVTLVHMIRLDESELDLLAASGARIVHCPAAAIRRAMGAIRIGRIPEMLARGVTVGLGSDGHSGKRDVARQAYLAATLHREMRDEFPVIDAYTALEMATLHGARAASLADEIGSLEVGRRADLVIHSTDRPESRPHLKDPVPNLVYHSQSRTVDSVMVDGEFIFDRGRFTRFDAEAMYRQIDAAAARIEARLDGMRPRRWPIAES